nr:MAG TPA: hypothetical protein [Caudoviricetes sp.]
MKLDQIKLLKVGDIVVDKVSGAEFIVTGIKEADKLPLCLQLISEIKDPIYLNYVATTTTAYAEKGDAYWIYLSHSIAYGAYSYPTVYTNRRIMTCEDLELKETAPWIKPKEQAKEEVETETFDYLISLNDLVKLSEKRLMEDLTTIDRIIKQKFLDNSEVAISPSLLKSKPENKSLIEEIRARGYTVKISDGNLVISGW